MKRVDQLKVIELLAILSKGRDTYVALEGALDNVRFDAKDDIDEATLRARLDKLRRKSVEIEMKLSGLTRT